MSAARSSLLLLLCMLVAAEAGAERLVREFFPLALGHRWTYRLHRDQLVNPSDKAPQRSFSRGKARTIVVTAGDEATGGSPRFGLREATLERDSRGGPASSDETLQIVSLSDEGLRLHETSPVGAPEGDAGRNAYDPPIRLAPDSLADGTRWKVGKVRFSKLEITLEGEVVGIEDVTVGSLDYPGCVKLRLQGPVRGQLFSDDGPVPVREGRYEREIWLLRDVGVVQDVVTIDLALEPPGGKPTQYSSVVRRRLESYSLADQ